jgi:CRISPR system Cascade subunit CasE
MYLSQLILNPRNRNVRRDLADAQALHRRVMSGFGTADDDANARAQMGVLYRVEVKQRTGAVELLVQSLVIPKWERLPPQYLRLLDGERGAKWKPIAELYARLQDGILLWFRLRANPTRKIETKTGMDGKKRNGKRVEIRDEQKQLAWLERKGAQHGFRVREVRAINENKRIGNRVSRSATSVPGISALMRDNVVNKQTFSPRLTFASVLFEGELIVTNKEMFIEALKRGIGSGKSYGFGLLSISS